MAPPSTHDGGAGPSNSEGLMMIPAAALSADPPGGSLRSMLGGWAQDPSALASAFGSSGEVPHVVIDDFFSAPVARELAASFPDAHSAPWHRRALPP